MFFLFVCFLDCRVVFRLSKRRWLLKNGWLLVISWSKLVYSPRKWEMRSVSFSRHADNSRILTEDWQFRHIYESIGRIMYRRPRYRKSRRHASTRTKCKDERQRYRICYSWTFLQRGCTWTREGNVYYKDSWTWSTFCTFTWYRHRKRWTARTRSYSWRLARCEPGSLVWYSRIQSWLYLSGYLYRRQMDSTMLNPPRNQTSTAEVVSSPMPKENILSFVSNLLPIPFPSIRAPEFYWRWWIAILIVLLIFSESGFVWLLPSSCHSDAWLLQLLRRLPRL